MSLHAFVPQIRLSYFLIAQNFEYWTNEIKTKQGWEGSFGDRSDGSIDSYLARMNEFAPGRTIGMLAPFAMYIAQGCLSAYFTACFV